MAKTEKKRVEGVLLIKEKETKKSVKKKKKKTSSVSKAKMDLDSLKREKLLIENFIGFQKAMVNLSIKFENLSDNISRLLNVFELSAKDYMVNKGRTNQDLDREILSRINALLEQNKFIMGEIRQVDNKIKKQEISKSVFPSQAVMTPPSQQSPVSQDMQQSGQASSQYIQSKPRTIVQSI